LTSVSQEKGQLYKLLVFPSRLTKNGTLNIELDLLSEACAEKKPPACRQSSEGRREVRSYLSEALDLSPDYLPEPVAA